MGYTEDGQGKESQIVMWRDGLPLDNEEGEEKRLAQVPC